MAPAELGGGRRSELRRCSAELGRRATAELRRSPAEGSWVPWLRGTREEAEVGHGAAGSRNVLGPGPVRRLLVLLGHVVVPLA